VTDFYVLVDEVLEILRIRGRMSFRALKLRFDLDDELLDTLKEELLYAYRGAVSEEGAGLVWAGDSSGTPTPFDSTRSAAHDGEPPEISATKTDHSPAAPYGQVAERRQLTVLFCDLVDSTPLSSRLDPEELREVVRAYQDACAKVIARYQGRIAKYLGDGLLVYFGYPQAHEDDAQRAVRAGLGIVAAMGQLNTSLTQERGVSLSVRLGCHTGLVVIEDTSRGARNEEAFGETLNIAARLQGVAAPNNLVIGALTFQLLGGVFACESLGTPPLKGVAQPLEVYRVLYESVARTRLEAIGSSDLTPLVGREPEVTLMLERWSKVEGGQGQALLLGGEAGIGKSRLVRVLTERAGEFNWWLTPCQCSPYYQHTAFYPLIDLLERVVLRFEREESASQKLRKLEGFLVQNGQPLAEAVPLFASLLSIPAGADYPLPDLSPEQQKQLTLRAVMTILLRIATEQPVLFVVEDLHWVDPTTLELLRLLVEQLDTARILALFTYRPDFNPPWAERSNVTRVTLSRLSPGQGAELIGRVSHGKRLPEDVLAQVVNKTDGVPLFVEELTKMLLESGLLEEREDSYELTGPLPPLAVPNTLQDSLMARLDRLAEVKRLAQLCASLGREFNYALLQAVSPWEERRLRRDLDQLVAAEFVYQQGLPPHATYRFKHALIQDAAYQSLLKSTRQQYNLRIAQTLESRFPETVAGHPELLAHHYTEAGMRAHALPYWQTAGQQALQRSANREAAVHVRKGLEVLNGLPDTHESARHELNLQIMLGTALGATQGQQATGPVYGRACELARRVGTTPELFPALWGSWYAHIARGEMPRARALAEEFLDLAQQQQDPLVLAAGHRMLANTALWQGELADAQAHCRQGLEIYDPKQHRASVISYGQDSGVVCGWIEALTLWVLGYPDQARQGMNETVARARALAHPFSVAQALHFSAHLHQLRREPKAAQGRAEEALTLCTEHGFDAYGTWCLLPRGWAVAHQNKVQEGIAYIQAGLAARRATGATAALPWFLALLGEAYGSAGQFGEGLRALDEALRWVQHNEEHLYEAEVYRLKGELLLGQSASNAPQAEDCFQEALAVAARQRALSWQLRATISLSRLLRRQGKKRIAHELLEPVYGSFVEGFDTADLQDAKALLDAAK
jgi:class 3 adenylate cyclase/predicted ATPase